MRKPCPPSKRSSQRCECSNPLTEGFEQLLAAIELIVDRQYSHPKSEGARRFLLSRDRTFRNVPLAFLSCSEQIVVAYKESSEGGRESSSHLRHPIYWVAERLTSGERFTCTIKPGPSLRDAFLAHLELPREHFANAISLASARERWRSFLRLNDQITAYHPGAVRLLEQLGATRNACLVLKSVKCDIPSRILWRRRTQFSRSSLSDFSVCDESTVLEN